ncbi:MAG: hypothetical protein DRN68_05950 [Thaumarchaeota archaeon]|nr:MAG: hypothetical protein DRN68_05950 [Nitrososphaerota archaeon]
MVRRRGRKSSSDPWKEAARKARRKRSRLLRAQKALDNIHKRVVKRVGYDDLFWWRHATKEERKRIRELQRIIEEEITKLQKEGKLPK